MADVTYDATIVGGGNKALVTAIYLAKYGGMQEVRRFAGERDAEKWLKAYELARPGGLATEESTLPMFLHNTHSIYHMMVDYAPAYKDLGLEENYRVKYVRPSLQFVMPFYDGRSLCLCTDVEKTCNSNARFSKKDADAYREMHRKFSIYMEAFLAPATYVPPLSALDQTVKLEASPIGKEILELSEKTQCRSSTRSLKMNR